MIVISILWMATGLRFYQLDAQSFWNDEGNSARLSERSLESIIEGTASDIHPPLYYLLLRGWRELLGESEFGLRSFSAYAGILTVAAVFALDRLLFSKKKQKKPTRFLILAAGFLAAINPALVYYSQETRMYSLLALISATSTIILWRWLNSKHGALWAVGYILTATAGLYTHYFFPAILIIHNLIVILWFLRSFGLIMFSPFELRENRSLIRTIIYWAGMMVILFLLYLPWLPIFWQQTGGRPAVRAPFPQFIQDSISWLSFGGTLQTAEYSFLIIAAAVLLIWALVVSGRRITIPLLGTAVTLLFMYAAGTTQPAFFKFMVTAVPFFVLWLGGALNIPHRWSQQKWLLSIPLLLFIPFLWGSAISLSNLYHNPNYARADYRGMVQRIAQDDYPNAGIILNAPNQWEVFTYYHRDGAPVYPLPKGQPDPAILVPELETIVDNHDRLYTLYWGDSQRDPNQVVETWLEDNTFKASEEWVGDVRFVIYAVPDQPAKTMDSTVNQTFGDQITLEGYSLNAGTLSAGEILQLTLFWQTAEPIDQRYKIFLHLLDQNGRLVTQRDSEPGGGHAPTNSWQPGQTITDNHGLLLPTNLQAGDYILVLGLYDSADPTARLPIQVDDAEIDAWVVGTISVE